MTFRWVSTSSRSVLWISPMIWATTTSRAILLLRHSPKVFCCDASAASVLRTSCGGVWCASSLISASSSGLSCRNLSASAHVDATMRLRKYSTRSLKTLSRSRPASASRAMTSSVAGRSFARIPAAIALSSRPPASPKMSMTSCSWMVSASEVPPQNAMTVSMIDCASRIPPSAALAMHASAPSSMKIPSLSAMVLSRPMISGTGILRRSKRWHLEMMVGSSLCGSVVAKMNFT